MCAGTLPEALYLLSQLQYLDLYNNHLHGNIPPGFAKLIMLHDLWLDGNEFGPGLRKAVLQAMLPNCRVRL